MISDTGAVFRGALAHNKARTVLSVIAIALGVALGYAVQLINQTAVNELTLGMQTLSGDADLDVRGPRGGFAENIYPTIAVMPEVAVASPVVEVDAKLTDRADALRIVGIDIFRAGYLQPGLIPPVTDRFDALRSDVLFLSPAAARWLDAKVGDTVVLQVALSDVPLRVAGLLTAGAAQRFAVMDIAAAQARFDRQGRITRIDLRLKPGVDPNAFVDRLGKTLPAGLAVDRPAASLAASAGLSRSYRVNLNVLALVALFTGGLLVFSTQALAVVRRRAPLALLRVLGVTRRRLVTLIVAESALIGVAGSVLGLGAGYALAHLALRWVGVDLGSGYFRGIAPTLALDPVSIALFLVLGVAAAVLGGFVPALEAARAAPAPALKAGDEQRAFTRLRPVWPGIVTVAAGAAATTLPPVSGLPVFGYSAIALLLIGTLMLMPRLAVLVLSVLPVPRDTAPQLALAQLRGAPGQVAVSLATIVASVSLMVSMAIMVSSFRHSLDDWLERVLPADVYLRASAGGDTAYLPPDVQARIAALPGVRRAEFLREAQLLLDPGRPRVTLLVRPMDATGIGSRLPQVGAAVTVAAGAPPPVWVSEAMVDLYDMRPGTEVDLPLAGKSGALHRCRRFSRLRAPAGRDRDRPRSLCRIDRRRHRDQRGAVARAGDERRRIERDDAARDRRRRQARNRGAGRDPRGVAVDLRSDVRGDLRAGARGRGDRARGPVVVVRRAGASRAGANSGCCATSA